MTLRDLQYATQDLIDCGASKDTDEVVAKAAFDGVRLYVRLGNADETAYIGRLDVA